MGRSKSLLPAVVPKRPSEESQLLSVRFQEPAIPVVYPILIVEQSVEPLQYPKTPKLTPPKVAIGIAFTIGVEIVDIKSSTKEANKSMESGVAGRSMTDKSCGS